MNTVAQIAALELTRRRHALTELEAAGKVEPEVADRLERCWLAIAAAAGAHALLPELIGHSHVIAPQVRAGQPVSYRHGPHDYCPAHEWQAELRRAEAAAWAKHASQPEDQPTHQRALDLHLLARTLAPAEAQEMRHAA